MKTSTTEASSASQKPMATPHIETGDSHWKRLYQVGGAAALMATGLEIANALISVISSSTSGPAPSTVIGWFTLL